MTVSSTVTRVSYTGDGVSVNFAVPFGFYASTDLLVVQNGVTKALAADYTVTGGLGLTGTVTMVVAPAAAINLQIILNPPITQTVALVDGTQFPAATLNQEADRGVQISLRLNDKLTRSLRAPDGPDVSAMSDLPSATARAGKYLSFDVTGQPSVSSGTGNDSALRADLAAGVPFLVSSASVFGLISMTTETTLTSNTTLSSAALSRAFVLIDSGAPANFHVDLPSGSAVGSLILLRVGRTATKLYTINGIDVGIDGESSRIMWRGESCLLMREASQWTKIGGVTIPFRGCLVRTASQAIAAGGTYVRCVMTDEVGDRYNLDICFGTVNGNFVAPRLASYRIGYNLSVGATSIAVGAALINTGLAVAGITSPTVQPATIGITTMPVGDQRVLLSSSGVFSLSSGDQVNLIGRILDPGTGAVITAPTFEVNTTIIAPTLSYEEIPLW